MHFYFDKTSFIGGGGQVLLWKQPSNLPSGPQLLSHTIMNSGVAKQLQRVEENKEEKSSNLIHFVCMFKVMDSWKNQEVKVKLKRATV